MDSSTLFESFLTRENVGFEIVMFICGCGVRCEHVRAKNAHLRRCDGFGAGVAMVTVPEQFEGWGRGAAA